ISTKT
ncbi:putative membrane protein, partial [Vibrio parahaemolyticus SBR10290]